MKAFQRPTCIVFAAALFLVPLSDWVCGAEPARDVMSLSAARRTVAELVRQLDADEFAIRQRAAQRLAELAAPPTAPAAAAALWEVWVSPVVSFEVRSQVRPLVRRLPRPRVPKELSPNPAAVANLVDGTVSDAFAKRLGAAARIHWLLDRPEWIVPLMMELESRLDGGRLSASDRRGVEKLWRQAHGAWLLSEPGGAALPKISEAQLRGWIRKLSTPTPADFEGRVYPPYEQVRRRLLDCLARDDLLPTTKALLEEAVSLPSNDAEAAQRIEAVLDWTRPAMVAEFWQATESHASGQLWSHHLGIQHLLVGVPSIPAGAERASHFDAINDRQAHCVSGNSLTPGDWPVGVAFPHPSQEMAFFQLVNLPTPRRRMAYEHYVQFDESQRLAEISRRTVDRFLEDKRRLTDREVRMLELLDCRAVSRFAPTYFQQIDDRAFESDNPLPREVGSLPAGELSHHASICVLLAAFGTREAIPGLLEAIADHRFLAPTPDAPYQVPWIAALAIARRDPWPKLDPWLAGLIELDHPLRLGDAPLPELGATAAAILAGRHSTAATDLGISPVVDEFMQQVGCPPFRFVDDNIRATVLNWWASLERDTAETTARRVGVP